MKWGIWRKGREQGVPTGGEEVKWGTWREGWEQGAPTGGGGEVENMEGETGARGGGATIMKTASLTVKYL